MQAEPLKRATGAPSEAPHMQGPSKPSFAFSDMTHIIWEPIV